MKLGNFLFFVMFLLFISSIHVNYTKLSSQTQKYNIKSSARNIDLIERSIIDIESDEDFQKYTLSGLGTVKEPFIIENYNITNPEEFSIGNISDSNRAGIYIRNTTNNFIIQNCFISGYYSGISIVLVKENTGIIKNNTLQAYSSGLKIVDSDDLICEKNICSGMSSGIIIVDSKNILISSNRCFDSNTGIEIFFSDYTSIKSNYASTNQIGIKITGSDSCNLYNNTCNNNKNGIVLGNSGVAWIPENPPPPDLKSCLLKWNLLVNNTEYGVVLEETTKECKIYYNFFVENKRNSQAFDAGKKNKWYNYWEKKGNFWSDIGESKTYTIDGAANSIDRYPLNENLKRTSQSILPSLLIWLFIALIFLKERRKKRKRTKFNIRS